MSAGTPQPDLSGLLNGLLSNPAALSALSSLLAGKMGGHPPAGQGCCDGGREDCRDDCPKAPPLLPPTHNGDCSPSGHGGPFDGRGQDKRGALLCALRPYLSPQRCDMMDSLLRILELLELLRKRR